MSTFKVEFIVDSNKVIYVEWLSEALHEAFCRAKACSSEPQIFETRILTTTVSACPVLR